MSEAPLGGAAVHLGGTTLSALPLTALHLIAPYPGALARISNALTAAYGMGLPGPGETAQSGDIALRWAGRDQGLLIGPADPAPSLASFGGVTDVSDVYVRLLLAGDTAPDVLARLVPLDLRPQRFEQGRTAKTMLGHLTAQITRTEAGIEAMVMRSFGKTAFHEIETAMRGVAARAALGPA